MNLVMPPSSSRFERGMYLGTFKSLCIGYPQRDFKEYGWHQLIRGGAFCDDLNKPFSAAEKLPVGGPTFLSDNISGNNSVTWPPGGHVQQ